MRRPPPHSGTSRLSRVLLTSLLQIAFMAGFAQFTVSGNGRYLLKEGRPFFWLGDTGWELFHRLTLEQADQYFRRRSEQGFTVIQAVALAESDGLHSPNAYGDLPLRDNDPSKPNEAYFRHVDDMIDRADTYGLVIGFLPTWGDKVWKAWGEGPEVFTPVNARVYGKWLGERYKDRKNIIWILGGDRNPQNATQIAIWREMAAGITEGAGTSGRPLISYHPQPNARGSGEFFYDDEWFAFNMFQNGHCRDAPAYEKIRDSYERIPVKPVLDGEPIYEDHPVCFNVQDLGTSTAYDVRRYAYLELFAGACGHTYGCHDIWQFYSPYRPAINGPHMYWQQAMELPGANQMQFLKKLMLSRSMSDRIPDQSLLLENGLAASERIQAIRGLDYLFVYTAAGKPFTLRLGKISGSRLNTRWYDPRNGSTLKSDTILNKGDHLFTPPGAGYGQDWVLIADNADKRYIN